MRIGIFTDTYPPFINGVSTSITMLQKALTDKGHKVYIVTVNPENMSYKYDEDDSVIRIPGIPVGIYDYRFISPFYLKQLPPINSLNTESFGTSSLGIGNIFLSKFISLNASG